MAIDSINQKLEGFTKSKKVEGLLEITWNILHTSDSSFYKSAHI